MRLAGERRHDAAQTQFVYDGPMAPHKVGTSPKAVRQAWHDAVVSVSLAVGELSDCTDALQVEFGANLTRLPNWAEVARRVASLKEATDALDAGLAYSIAPEPFEQSQAAHQATKSKRK